MNKKYLSILLASTLGVFTLCNAVESINSHQNNVKNLTANNNIQNNFSINKMNGIYNNLDLKGKENLSQVFYTSYIYFFGVILTKACPAGQDIKTWFNGSIIPYLQGAGKYQNTIPTGPITDSAYNFLFGSTGSIMATAATIYGWTYDTAGGAPVLTNTGTTTIMDLINNVLSVFINVFIAKAVQTPATIDSTPLGIMVDDFLKNVLKSPLQFGKDISGVLATTFLRFAVGTNDIYNSQTANSEFAISSGDVLNPTGKPIHTGSLLFASIFSTIPDDIIEYGNPVPQTTFEYIQNSIGNFIYAQNLLEKNYELQLNKFNGDPSAALEYLVVNRAIFPFENNPLYPSSLNSMSNFSPLIYTKGNIPTFESSTASWDLYTKTIFQQSQNSLNNAQGNIFTSENFSGIVKFPLKDMMLFNPLAKENVSVNDYNIYFPNGNAMTQSYNSAVTAFGQIATSTGSFSDSLNAFIKSDLNYVNNLIEGTKGWINTQVDNPLSSKLLSDIATKLSSAELSKYYDVQDNNTYSNGKLSFYNYIDTFSGILTDVYNNFTPAGPDKNKAPGLSTGAIIGIAVAAAVIFLAIAGTGSFYGVKKYKQKHK